MEILYLLIPMSVALVALIALALLWAVKSGQFEDMEGPAHRILMDEEEVGDAREGAQEIAESEKSTKEYREEASENK